MRLVWLLFACFVVVAAGFGGCDRSATGPRAEPERAPADRRGDRRERGEGGGEAALARGGDPVPERRVDVALGGLHACALVADGAVYCWGGNRFGQLGDPSERTGYAALRPEARRVAELSDVVRIAAGTWHTCALRGDGRVACWGHGAWGQLGDGAREDRSAPVLVAGIDDAVEIAAGEGHTCARRASRRVSCWGRGDYGQLGTGLTEGSVRPVEVSGLGDAVQLASGRAHVCALRANGDVACWGFAIEGQLGARVEGDFAAAPVAGPRIDGVAEIVAGGSTTCARLQSGGVACWGRNDSGQLGSGTGGSPGDATREPVPIAGIGDAVQVGAGARHTCVVRRGGEVRCAGLNAFGQLGDRTTDSRREPVIVQGLTGAARVAAGVRHTCALLAAGGVVCWGENGTGRLGDGTTDDRAVPVAVRGLPGQRAD